MENLATNPQSINLLLMALLKRLENIEEKLDKKVAYLSTEEAVSAYRMHLREGINRKGRHFSNDSIRNFDWILEKFYNYFPDKNVAEITTDECAGFLNTYWDKNSNGSLKQRQLQLRIFFNFCILYLKKKGNPIFHNPCDLLDPIEYTPEKPEWIPVEAMGKLIESAKREHHYIAFSILTTSGLRINDLMNLRKCDVDGRILKLRMHGDYRPKSGKKEETAVIPQIVADRLALFLADRKEKDNIIPVTEIAIYKAVSSHGKALGLDIGPHSLRKWIASYWERKGEYGMVSFVLRHSATKLRDRYVAPLTTEEAMAKQELMEKELFKPL